MHIYVKYQALKFVPKIFVSALALALLPVTLLGLPSVYGGLFGCVRQLTGLGVMLCMSVTTLFWVCACKENVLECTGC